MGACFSCLPHLFTNRRASAGDDADFRRQRRCRRFITCCGLCDALFQRTEEQDASSGPLLQSLEESSAESHPHDSFLEARDVSTVSSSVRQDKAGTNLVQIQGGETHHRNISGTSPCVMEPLKIKEYERGQNPNMSQLQLPKKSEKFEAITSLLDDDDICPTCLDGYDAENPKIFTKCGHHFHLACILEWMERSSHCPLCDKEMVIVETS